MRPPTAWVPLLLLTACDATGVAVGVPRLVAPETVTLDGAVFGSGTFVEVPISNVGTSDVSASASAEAPFAVAGDAVQIGAGDQVALSVLFTPATYDAATGTLVLETSRQRLVIELVATVDTDADGDQAVALGAGGTDCDDGDASVHPAADEVCNGLDDDCDGVVDADAAAPPTWYVDLDADGYGVDDGAITGCERPTGTASVSGDCDDADPAVHPGASEKWYDGVDQDCDERSDYDADRDGYENAGFGGDDCVDSNAGIHPGATETWYDGVDQDCDGADDYDADGDGSRPPDLGGDDCDDGDATVGPDAPELDDGADQDCDGWIDEDFLVRGDLVISEVLLDPVATDDADGQYVELYNASARTVDLTGFTLRTTAGTSTLSGGTLPPGDAVVVCANDDATANGGLACAGVLAGTLGAADDAALAAEIALDEVDWSTFVAAPGAAWELGGTWLDPDQNDAASRWCVATADLGNGDLGTPGIVDAPCP